MDETPQENAEGAPTSEPPKLKLKREMPIGGGQTQSCPSCGVSIPADAVLCVHCGYDLRSGSRLKTSRGIPRNLKILLGLLAGILVVGVAGALWLMFTDSDEPFDAEPPRDDAPSVSAAEPDRERAPTEDSEGQESMPEGKEDAEEDAGLDERAAEQQAREEAAREERKREFRESLMESLDERVPMYEVGDSVELIQHNGLVHRGRLVAIRDGVALLIDEELRSRVELRELATHSRLRVDVDYRDQVIQRRLEELLAEEE